MSTIAYPQMRADIVSAVASLANPLLHSGVWIARGAPLPGLCYSFTDLLHALYDDSGLGDGVDSCIGYALYDFAEALRLSNVMNQVDDLLEKYGVNKPDATYVQSPEWPPIVSSATQCLQLFLLNDRLHQVDAPGGRESSE